MGGGGTAGMAGAGGATDAGPDARNDVGADTAPDTQGDAPRDTSPDMSVNPDATSDATVDRGTDTGSEAASDGGSEAAADAGTDSATPVDAPGDTGPDAGGRTVVGILRTKSPACLTCAQDNCATEMNGCTNVMGNAMAGPAAGVSRQTLCLDTLECVETSNPNCAAALLNKCYCGSAVGTACLSQGAPDGVCKTALERGLETTEPATIATSFTQQDLGAGAAMFLVQCLNDNQCMNCF
jgi:hypothetical protein